MENKNIRNDNKFSIKSINVTTGKFISWSIVLIVLLLLYEVLMRYLLNTPSIWSTEIIMYIYSFYILFLLGYTLIYNQHIRVDILYSKYSNRKKYFIDVIGYILFFFNFCFAVIIGGYGLFIDSFISQEKSSSVFSIILWPKKLAILLGFLLLLFAGISDFFGKLIYLLSNKNKQ